MGDKLLLLYVHLDDRNMSLVTADVYIFFASGWCPNSVAIAIARDFFLLPPQKKFKDRECEKGSDYCDPHDRGNVALRPLCT